MRGLVLSLFPGIGLLDMAFEEEGFCVVRGPDLLWGGDVRRFHPPYGKFDGIIGGPPCQAFSQLRHIVEANGFQTAPDLIPEFIRCIEKARPQWFVMENVRAAPVPNPEGYRVTNQIIQDVWVGGETSRERRFSFGLNTILHDERGRFQIVTEALHRTDPAYAVTCDARERPVALLAGMRPKKPREVGGKSSSLNRGGGALALEEMARRQGVPAEFVAALREHGAFTTKAIRTGIGNGVPLSMGRAVAKAVVRALAISSEAA